jgi:hypothetical protein
MGNCFSAPKKRTLYLILPYSNPAKFKRREELLLQTYERLGQYKGCDELVVIVSQLVFQNESPLNFPDSLVFRTDKRNILWSKENLINLAIQDVLRRDKSAKYFAFVDADITFENMNFVSDTIDKLQAFSFVQMFQTAKLEGPQEHQVYSFGYKYSKGQEYKSVSNTNADYWHPGFAWAIHKDAFLACNGLIEFTLGSADRHMAMAAIGRAKESIPDGLSAEYVDQVMQWQQRAKAFGMGLSYVPGNIIHHWHGDLKNRKYMERWDILRKHAFQPSAHMEKDKRGLIVWKKQTDNSFVEDVCLYFALRNEDQPIEECVVAPKQSGSPSMDREEQDEKNNIAAGITVNHYFPPLYAGAL